MPAWTVTEVIVLVYFLSRGFDVSGVRHLIHKKCKSELRNEKACEEKFFAVLNQERIYRNVEFYTENEWDLAAVDEFLLWQTDSSNLLDFCTRWSDAEREVIRRTHKLGLAHPSISWELVDHQRGLVQRHANIYGILPMNQGYQSQQQALSHYERELPRLPNQDPSSERESPQSRQHGPGPTLAPMKRNE